MKSRPPLFWIRWAMLLICVVLLDQLINRILFPEPMGLARYLISGVEMVVIYCLMSWVYGMKKFEQAESK